MKQFPVLSSDQAMGRRSDIPWDFIETFRKRVEYNHSQTLEVLAKRGGLSFYEIYASATDSSLSNPSIVKLNGDNHTDQVVSLVNELISNFEILNR